MFIELTDHLRCPAPHDEQFLVLLPGPMEGRRVVSGTLGCPFCGLVVELADGTADFGGNPPAPAPTALTAGAVLAFLGLEGPGGYVALFGAAGNLAADLGRAMPGVSFVLVNPPPDVVDSAEGSVLRSERPPIKARAMRAVVVAADHASLATWRDAAIGSVLPGNRAIVEAPAPERDDVEVLAEGGGVAVLRVGGGGRR